MANNNLDKAFEYFSTLYGVNLTDFEKQEVIKNLTGYFAALHEADTWQSNQ